MHVKLRQDHPLADDESLVVIEAAPPAALRAIAREAPHDKIRFVEDARYDDERIALRVVRDDGPRMIVWRHAQLTGSAESTAVMAVEDAKTM